MLKFVVEAKAAEPALVGLGLSWENLRLLRRDAIQFHGADLGLGAGVFVIAHAEDPLRAQYEALVGSAVCDVVTLAEDACQGLQHAGDVIRRPLRCTRGGRACEAMVFAGSTEEALLEAMRARGLVSPATTVTAPPLTFGPDPLNLAKHGLGAVGFLALTGVVWPSLHRDGVELAVVAMLAATSAVFFGLLFQRWSSRVEVDALEVRCTRPVGSFAVRFADLVSVGARSDSLGPFELHLELRDGTVYTLARTWKDWDRLVAAIVASGPVS